MELCTVQVSSICLVPGGCRLPGAMMGFQDGNIISEPTAKVPSGADRITEASGEAEDAASGHCSAECQGQALFLLLALGCVTQELSREGQRVSLPGQVGGRTDRVHLCIRHLPPCAKASPILPGIQGREQEGQAWRWGQLSAGEPGCWRRGSWAPLRALRDSVSSSGVRGEHGMRRGPASVRERWRRAASCGGPARKWVRLAAPPTPIILGRRARPQTGPGLRGDPSSVLPALRPRVPPSHLPAERRSLEPAIVVLPLGALSRRQSPTSALWAHSRRASQSASRSLEPRLLIALATPPPEAVSLPRFAPPSFGLTSPLRPAHHPIYQ